MFLGYILASLLVLLFFFFINVIFFLVVSGSTVSEFHATVAWESQLLVPVKEASYETKIFLDFFGGNENEDDITFYSGANFTINQDDYSTIFITDGFRNQNNKTLNLSIIQREGQTG